MDIPKIEVKPITEAERQKANTPPPGWWSLRDVSGSLAGVTKAVDEDSRIPDHWKVAIKAELAVRCSGDFNFVWLDAHCVLEKGNTVVDIHITPDKKLL